MPKFLDVPSWYNSQGTLTYGVGVDTNERPGVGNVPCVHLPSGELNWRALMVNGAQSGDINIYAPTAKGNDNSVCIWNGDDYRPDWVNPGNNPAVLAYSASAESTSWLESTVSGQVLTNSGYGGLHWVSPANVGAAYGSGEGQTNAIYIDIKSSKSSSTTVGWAMYLKVIGDSTYDFSISTSNNYTICHNLQYFDGFIFHTHENRIIDIHAYTQGSVGSSFTWNATPVSTNINLSTSDKILISGSGSRANFSAFWCEIS